MQHLRGRLTEELEAYATEHDIPEVMEMAARVQREHEWRMEQCQHETVRAMTRYLRSVVTDYSRGIKRRRRDEDGGTCWHCAYSHGLPPEMVCTIHGGRKVGHGDYCSEWESEG